MRRLIYLVAALALLVPGATASTFAQSAPQVYTGNFLQGEPDNIDPSHSSFATEAAVIRQVFEPLLRFDHNLVPQPAAVLARDGSARTILRRATITDLFAREVAFGDG